jgi:cell division protein FtsB
MESGAALFILIAALLLVGVPALAIAAYVRVDALKRATQAEAAQLIRRIYALEQQMRQLEKGLSALPAPAGAAAAPGPP